jgi:hypothetical protein
MAGALGGRANVRSFRARPGIEAEEIEADDAFGFWGA